MSEMIPVVLPTLKLIVAPRRNERPGPGRNLTRRSDVEERTCSIEGCGRSGKIVRGWCRMHYARWQKYGNPLTTKRSGVPVEAFGLKAVVQSGCWEWTGATNGNGYAQLRVGGRLVRAHRWAYEHFVGLIPPGFDIDHTCHNRDALCPGGRTCRHRRCCNPEHLEAVPHIVNAQRGRTGQHLASRTHCVHGHLYDQANTIIDKRGNRHCRECKRAEGREYQRRKRAGL